MFHHLQENIKDWTNVDEIDTYFTRMLNKEAYDKTGLIYGIGHAVYTISDPRAILLKELARDLAKKKERNVREEFAFLELWRVRFRIRRYLTFFQWNMVIIVMLYREYPEKSFKSFSLLANALLRRHSG